MSDADQVELSFSKETAFGVDPAASYQALRFTGEGLRLETSTARSAEIVADRQTTDIIRTNISAAGNVNVEMSAETMDEMFLASLLADASQEAAFDAGTTVDRSGSGAIDFNSTGTDPDLIVDGGSSGSFASGDLYSWIQVTGSSDNNGYYKIVTVTDVNTIRVEPANLTQDTDDTAVVIKKLPHITNSTTLRTYSWQRRYLDLTNTWESIRGTAPDQMNMNVATENIITGGFTFIGSIASSGSGAGITPTAATTTQVMNAIDHVNYFGENSDDFGIIGFTMTLANNLRARLQVGTLGAISLGKGQVAINGTVQSYFTANAHFDRYLNFGVTNLAVVLVDDATKGYIIDLPSVKLSAGQRVAGSQNSDVINDMSWEAYKDATEGITIRIAKVVPAS